MRKVLLFLSASVLVFAPLSAAHASGQYHVTVNINHTSITKGDKVTISGHVSGGPVSGQTVSVSVNEGSVNNDNGSISIGHANLSGGGNYSKSWEPPTGGVWTVTVTKHHSGSTHGMSVTSDSLKVFRWTSLSNFYDSFDTVAPSGKTTKKINGKSYPHSFKIAAGSQLAFEPTGQEDKFFCSSYEANVGVADGSLSGVLGNYSFSEGSHEIDSQNRHEGHSAVFVHKDMPVNSSAPFLTMVAQFHPTSTSSYWVVGNPKGFCALP